MSADSDAMSAKTVAREQKPGACVPLMYGREPAQWGELYVPERSAPPYPIVILIHGGFWRTPYDLSLMEGLAQDLRGQGIAVWNIEYRRIGDPGGGWPGTFQDVARATDYLQTLAPLYALDLQRVVTVGHSAGGHLALWLAIRQKIVSQGVLALEEPAVSLLGAVSLAGANDLEHVWQLHLGGDAVMELLGGSPYEVPERYQAASPAAHLPLGIPQILVHGTKDNPVPFVVSQKYADKAQQAGDSVTLVEVPGGDHFIVIDPTSSAWAMAKKEMERGMQFP